MFPLSPLPPIEHDLPALIPLMELIRKCRSRRGNNTTGLRGLGRSGQRRPCIFIWSPFLGEGSGCTAPHTLWRTSRGPRRYLCRPGVMFPVGPCSSQLTRTGSAEETQFISIQELKVRLLELGCPTKQVFFVQFSTANGFQIQSQLLNIWADGKPGDGTVDANECEKPRKLYSFAITGDVNGGSTTVNHISVFPSHNPSAAFRRKTSSSHPLLETCSFLNFRCESSSSWDHDTGDSGDRRAHVSPRLIVPARLRCSLRDSIPVISITITTTITA
ncbi:hypothetical protein J6590_013228 [Homalodisca vitripennis]|nr:hypothetical protein J6590_013228 [Homalodisca vitripennis]